MAITFTKATKKRRKAKVALIGPPGGGKTKTGLQLLRALVGPEGRIAVLDTERGSASLYADEFDFDVAELETFHPKEYIAGIEAIVRGEYHGALVDGLSHAWMGKDGALELVDKASQRSRGNSFAGWRDVTPLHNALVDALTSAPIHLVVTMRSKMEYVLEEVTRDGRTTKVPRKLGMAPIQRDGLEYEFDVVADLDPVHNDMIIGKTRCSVLRGQTYRQDGTTPGNLLRAWLEDGEEAPPTPPKPEPAKQNGAADPSIAYVAMLLEASTLAELEPIRAAAKQNLHGAALNTFRKAHEDRYRVLHEAS